MIFSTVSRGPRGQTGRVLKCLGWISTGGGAAVLFGLYLYARFTVDDFDPTIPILVGSGLLLAGACFLLAPMALLIVPPRAIRSRECRRCGYNLTGLLEPRCPECGEPFGTDQNTNSVT
jgi:hypothetical protein